MAEEGFKRKLTAILSADVESLAEGEASASLGTVYDCIKSKLSLGY